MTKKTRLSFSQISRPALTVLVALVGLGLFLLFVQFSNFVLRGGVSAPIRPREDIEFAWIDHYLGRTLHMKLPAQCIKAVFKGDKEADKQGMVESGGVGTIYLRLLPAKGNMQRTQKNSPCEIDVPAPDLFEVLVILTPSTFKQPPIGIAKWQELPLDSSKERKSGYYLAAEKFGLRQFRYAACGPDRKEQPNNPSRFVRKADGVYTLFKDDTAPPGCADGGRDEIWVSPSDTAPDDMVILRCDRRTGWQRCVLTDQLDRWRADYVLPEQALENPIMYRTAIRRWLEQYRLTDSKIKGRVANG